MLHTNKIRFTTIDAFPCEPGYPCAHRSIHMYCTDQNMTSENKLFDHYYLPFLQRDKSNYGGKGFKLSSWKKYMDAYFPTYHLNRLKEDCCEICTSLKLQVKNPKLSAEDRAH